MNVLRCELGLYHIISDGPSPSRLYALCDILNTAELNQKNLETAVDEAITKSVARSHRDKVPDRNWGPEDVVDAIPSCLTCITTVREAIGG